jgi:hypothetical protein
MCEHYQPHHNFSRETRIQFINTLFEKKLLRMINYEYISLPSFVFENRSTKFFDQKFLKKHKFVLHFRAHYKYKLNLVSVDLIKNIRFDEMGSANTSGIHYGDKENQYCLFVI